MITVFASIFQVNIVGGEVLHLKILEKLWVCWQHDCKQSKIFPLFFKLLEKNTLKFMLNVSIKMKKDILAESMNDIKQ